MKNFIKKVCTCSKKIPINLKRHHKKYLFGVLCCWFLALIGTLFFSRWNADSILDYLDNTGLTWMRINLTTWWNVVSTPALVSSVSFSNWWDGINFFEMENWSWAPIIPSLNIFKPLEWFLVQNSTDGDVEMVLNYKETTDPTESIFQKSLSLWWNLVWVTTNVNPLNHIAWVFSMALNLTDDWWNDYVNHVWAHFNINTNNPTVLYSPEFWEAYWVFVTSNNAVYGWVNTKRRFCTAFERVRCHLYHSEDWDIANNTWFYNCLSSCTYGNYENEPEIGVYVKNASNNSVSRIEFDNLNLAEFTLYNGTDHILRSLELSGFINPLNGGAMDVNDIIINIEGRTLIPDEYTISESGILLIQNLEINVYGTPRVRIALKRNLYSQVLENLGWYEFNIELSKVNWQNTADFNYQSRKFKTYMVAASVRFLSQDQCCGASSNYSVNVNISNIVPNRVITGLYYELADWTSWTFNCLWDNNGKCTHILWNVIMNPGILNITARSRLYWENIKKIWYSVNGNNILIDKDVYPLYFKTSDGENLKIFGRTIALMNGYYDENALSNQYDKSILAGTDEIIYEHILVWEDEDINEITLYFNKDISPRVWDVKLYYDDVLVCEWSKWFYWDNTKFKFNDCNFIVRKDLTWSLKIELNTIETMINNDTIITEWLLEHIYFKVTWMETLNINSVGFGTNCKEFDIVPATVSPSLFTLTGDITIFDFFVNKWNNIDSNWNDINIYYTWFTLSTIDWTETYMVMWWVKELTGGDNHLSYSTESRWYPASLTDVLYTTSIDPSLILSARMATGLTLIIQ